MEAYKMTKIAKPKSAAKKPAASKAKTAVKKPAKTTPTRKTKKSAAKKLSTNEIQARTAQKAYEIFEQRGFSHGNDFNDWVEAEKKVLSEV